MSKATIENNGDLGGGPLKGGWSAIICTRKMAVQRLIGENQRKGKPRRSSPGTTVNSGVKRDVPMGRAVPSQEPSEQDAGLI